MSRLFVFLLLVLITACGTKSPVESPTAKAAVIEQDFYLLDSAAASDFIVIDTTDGFFDMVTLVEMSIQMKKSDLKGVTRNSLLPNYQAFLKEEVSSFTPEETAQVTAVMELAKKQCDALDPAIFPQGVAIIKVKTNHYGPSVYYTRENGIMVPEDVLTNFDPEGFLGVMLHEIFHVYSRFHPEEREALYKLVGFRYLEDVVISDSWKDLLLFNPDGVSFHWGIDLNIEGESVLAVPLISSNNGTYKGGDQSSFFSYLAFNLHQTKKEADGSYQVGNPIGPKAFPALFEKITNNTQYIIHPDEIMADNFMYLTYPTDTDEPREFDEPGAKLQAEVKAVLEGKK